MPTKVCIVKAMVFPVVTCSCESWTIKKAEHQRIDVLEKAPESPLDSKIKSANLKGSTLNIHWKDWCWRWSSSILVIWCEQTAHQKSPWCWESLRAEGEEGVRGWRGGWHHQCNGLGQTLGDGEGQRELAYCSPWGLKESDTTEATYRACTQARCTPLEQGKPHTTHTQPKVDIHKHI